MLHVHTKGGNSSASVDLSPRRPVVHQCRVDCRPREEVRLYEGDSSNGSKMRVERGHSRLTTPAMLQLPFEW
jgi:hypothetical protein